MSNIGLVQLKVTPDRHSRMILAGIQLDRRLDSRLRIAGMTGATVSQNQGFPNHAQISHKDLARTPASCQSNNHLNTENLSASVFDTRGCSALSSMLIVSAAA